MLLCISVLTFSLRRELCRPFIHAARAKETRETQTGSQIRLQIRGLILSLWYSWWVTILQCSPSMVSTIDSWTPFNVPISASSHGEWTACNKHLAKAVGVLQCHVRSRCKFKLFELLIYRLESHLDAVMWTFYPFKQSNKLCWLDQMPVSCINYLQK